MKPRYTFSTLGKDGRLYYPYKYGFVEKHIVWPGWDFTQDITKAITWDKPEDFDCLMHEYENTELIEITGTVSKIYKIGEKNEKMARQD